MKLRYIWATAAVLSITQVWACDPQVEYRSFVTVHDATRQYQIGNDWSQVSTVGSLENSSDKYLDDVVIEVQYYDSSGQLIDTATESNYSAVIPPHGTIAFRVDTQALKPETAYARQEVTVTYAGAKGPCKKQSPWKSTAIAWSPFLLLVAIWLWIYRRNTKSKSKKSYVQLMEDQIELSKESTDAIKRLASAAEALAGMGREPPNEQQSATQQHVEPDA